MAEKIAEIIDKIKKPFLLETKIGFSNNSVTKGLDAYVLNWLDKLNPQNCSNPAQKLISALKADFEKYKSSGSSCRKHIIGRSYFILAGIEKLLDDKPGILPALKPLGDLSVQVRFLKGVGPRVSQILANLGVKTMADLLYYFPRDYEDRSQFTQINSLKPGQLAVVVGRIKKVKLLKTRRGRGIIKVLISDNSGTLQAVWFNQPYLQQYFENKVGSKLLLSGKLDLNAFSGGAEFAVKYYELVEGDEKEYLGLIPHYPLTEGLTQKKMRVLVKEVLVNFLPQISDTFSADFRRQFALIESKPAIKSLHFPSDQTAVAQAHLRLAFEDLFFYQLGLALKRYLTVEQAAGISFEIKAAILAQFENSLPFKFTSSQQKVMAEIKADMCRDKPMNRLLQGDVGSGKTIVAAGAALIAVSNGYQAALMAPTEILAQQHFLKLTELLKDLGIQTVLLTSGLKPKEKNEIKSKIAKGSFQLIIGTHALISEDLSFKNLGLCLIDEQHRFGVLQRTKLKNKSSLSPDLLVMTATPIPRTMSLTLFGDLDKSVIDQLPPGRIPAQTLYKTEPERDEVYDFVRKKIMGGSQAFVVCPLVEESEKLDLAAAKNEFQKLSAQVFPEFKLALIHGRLKSAEKDRVMKLFQNGRIDILVATSVIEVGIDVPNANLMLIEQAERFGLSALHQLRGRIGRGGQKSYCFLMGNFSPRVEAVLNSNNGFEIAEADLRLRGPGDFCGVRQSGLPPFRVADLVKDEKILKLARRAAFDLIKKDPDLSAAGNERLKKELFNRYGKFLRLESLD